MKSEKELTKSLRIIATLAVVFFTIALIAASFSLGFVALVFFLGDAVCCVIMGRIHSKIKEQDAQLNKETSEEFSVH